MDGLLTHGCLGFAKHNPARRFCFSITARFDGCLGHHCEATVFSQHNPASLPYAEGVTPQSPGSRSAPWVRDQQTQFKTPTGFHMTHLAALPFPCVASRGPPATAAFNPPSALQ